MQVLGVSLTWLWLPNLPLFIYLFIYLFIHSFIHSFLTWKHVLLILEREEGREEREREERETNIDVKEKHWSFASCTCSDQGSHLQPRHVPWLGIEEQPFGVWDDAPTNWATWPGLNLPYLQSGVKIIPNLWGQWDHSNKIMHANSLTQGLLLTKLPTCFTLCLSIFTYPNPCAHAHTSKERGLFSMAV